MKSELWAEACANGAIPYFDSLPWPEQVDYVRKHAVGSVWLNRKSGRPVTVSNSRGNRLTLRRSKGKDSTIEEHYFASDYLPTKKES